MVVKDADLYFECQNFLNHEAQLLDERELEDWLDLLTEDIEYEVPVRTSREKEADSEFSKESYYFLDDRATLEARVKRFHTEYAWAENPPSRTQRFVTNLRVLEDGDEISTRNSLLIVRTRGKKNEPQFVVGERYDDLRRVDGDLKLASRTVHLNQTVVDMAPMSFFL